MTIQAYRSRLALGRSAYEPPEPSRGEQQQPGTELDRDTNAFLASGYEESADGRRDGPSSPAIERAVPFMPYTQQYDFSGRPINSTSRASFRNLIRAQNDVLSHIGICVTNKGLERTALATDGNSEMSKVRNVMIENGLGFGFNAIALGLLFISLWGLKSARNNIQVFRIFSEISFSQGIKLRREMNGLANILLAGMPAHLVFLASTRLTDHLLVECLGWQELRIRRYMPNVESVKVGRFMEAQFRILKFTSYACFGFPLQLFSILQRLSIEPCKYGVWPITPHLQDLIPFSNSSPLQLPSLSLSMAPGQLRIMTTSILTSPLVCLWLLDGLRESLYIRVLGFFRDVVPRPDNPDRFSREGAFIDQLDDDDILGIGHPNLSDDRRRSVDIPIWLGMLEEAGARCLEWALQILSQPQAQNLCSPTETPHRDIDDGPNTEVPLRRPESPNVVSEIPELVVQLDGNGEMITSRDADESNISSSEEVNGDARLQRQAQIQAAEEAMTMEVEISGPPMHLTGTFTHHTDQSHQRQIRHDVSTHHVTTLTGHFADLVCVCISEQVSSWLASPLEGLVMRMIASASLAAAVIPRQKESTAYQRPQFNSGRIGLGNWRTIFGPGPQFSESLRGYLLNVAVCFGLEALVRFTIAEAGHLAAVLVGYRRFGWQLYNRVER